MQPTHLIRAGRLALFLTLIFTISWEIYLRHKLVTISYDDNEALFADKMSMIYGTSDQSTVFIGSSRIKYDLDIPTWEALTGTKAVQLANVGSSPRIVLEDLANDAQFKGNLIVDVTEPLFFSLGAFYDGKTKKKLAYYRNRTPTQRFSFQVNHALESRFVFLDQDNFSINAMLDNAQLLPPREGVFPGLYFPREFEQVSFDRQSYMTPEFVADTNKQVQVRNIWVYGIMQKHVPLPKDQMDGIFNSVKRDVDKIKARGGQVLFVRTPSSGPYREAEVNGFPKTDYWDRLLTLTGCPGIYFTDYPAIANFVCPEWSHLKPTDAIIYTKALVKILEEEKGWKFPPKTNKSITANR
jgi:hypothetical protein